MIRELRRPRRFYKWTTLTGVRDYHWHLAQPPTVATSFDLSEIPANAVITEMRVTIDTRRDWK